MQTSRTSPRPRLCSNLALPPRSPSATAVMAALEFSTRAGMPSPPPLLPLPPGDEGRSAASACSSPLAARLRTSRALAAASSAAASAALGGGSSRSTPRSSVLNGKLSGGVGGGSTEGWACGRDGASRSGGAASPLWGDGGAWGRAAVGTGTQRRAACNMTSSMLSATCGAHSVRVHMRMCACVCDCVCDCVCARVRAHVCMYVCVPERVVVVVIALHSPCGGTAGERTQRKES
eukprot:365642-Chlamydomonas_euryale.AAC.5